MKESIYKNYEELPLMLNAKQIGALFESSISSAYELMREDGFSIMRNDPIDMELLVAQIEKKQA